MFDDEGQTAKVQEHARDLEDQVQVAELPELLFDEALDEQDDGEVEELVGDNPHGVDRQSYINALDDRVEEDEADQDGDGGQASADTLLVQDDPRS
jgi:hypothetical protein